MPMCYISYLNTLEYKTSGMASNQKKFKSEEGSDTKEVVSNRRQRGKPEEKKSKKKIKSSNFPLQFLSRNVVVDKIF